MQSITQTAHLEDNDEATVFKVREKTYSPTMVTKTAMMDTRQRSLRSPENHRENSAKTRPDSMPWMNKPTMLGQSDEAA